MKTLHGTYSGAGCDTSFLTQRLHNGYQSSKTTRTRILWSGSVSDANRIFRANKKLTPYIELLSSTESMTESLKRLTKSQIIVKKIPQPTTIEWQSFVRTELSHSFLPRSVILASDSKQPLIYAHSWWNQEDYEKIMIFPKMTIWSNLQRAGIEPTRNIIALFIISCPELQAILGEPDSALIGREYLFKHEQKVLTTIVEILAINNLRSFT